MPNCKTCIYDGLDWFELPCDGGCDAHSGYESRACRNCRWHIPVRSHGDIKGYMCGNEFSENDGIETRKDDSCDEWEMRYHA